ncbi:MAG: hypothetical protein H6819_06160 [Phycisphaerales bacterium]|nr:hypothetical protein [Phycisphaerales bacterium]MCB9858596.1 hypothetical protein [Phycisphaerales bacterium]
MATYPTSPRADFLQWCQSHQQVFVDNAATIGLTTEQAAAFATETSAAVAADLAQASSKESAKVATQTVNDAVSTLQSSAGDVVRSIRAYAELQADPNSVYNTAQIPPPASPTPAPPPAQPTDLTVTLEAASGDLMLSWKAANPSGTSGTSYIIRRRLPTESEFSFIGVSGKKKFVDTTLVAGPDSVQYTVQGQRSDSAGPVSQIFVVTFGQLSDGTSSAYVGASAPRAAIAAKAPTNGNGNGYTNGSSANGLSRMGV